MQAHCMPNSWSSEEAMDITNDINAARYNNAMFKADAAARKDKSRIASPEGESAMTKDKARLVDMPKNGESSSTYFMDEIKKGNSFDEKGKARDPKLWDTCIEMESIFVKQMLTEMKKNVEKGEFLHGGYAEDIFEDMLYDQYATNMSKNANMGLAKTLYTQLSSI